MEPPPPPPPPHGSTPHPGPKSGGLPDGKYDIFIIPPSSAGSGFLYLPSLATQRNSFLAGVVCTSAAFFFYQIAVPVVKEWFFTTVNGGGSGVFMLMVGVGVISWAFGKTQGEGVSSGTGSTPRPSAGQSTGHGYTGPPPQPSSSSAPPPPPPPQPPPPAPEEPPPQASPPPPKSSWQRPQPNFKASADAKSSWEKAREETRKREQEKRTAEEIKRRKDELEKERLRQREKEARERLERELKEKREREDRERKEREDKEKREKLEAEKKEREIREKIIQEAKEREEKLKKELEEAKAKSTASTSPKKPPIPTAATERDDDAYSFRPYDRPKRAAKTNSAGSVYSEDSYAPSATTAKTTPPPSVRGPYTTKDPDKIIIKAVYSFNNAFTRTPIAQLVSGQGHVTDGLILRITTEGLFIDDDVRGVPQREWDVKAWTLKLAEVWCPGIPNTNQIPLKDYTPFSFLAVPRRAFSSSAQDSSAVFLNMLTGHCVGVCLEASEKFCRSREWLLHERKFPSASSSASANTDNTVIQSCEINGQHVLRASIRDQEGKRYVFIIGQSEGWKVAVGLQRLRKGTQVRALAVAGMPLNEAKALLENLGWSGKV